MRSIINFFFALIALIGFIVIAMFVYASYWEPDLINQTYCFLSSDTGKEYDYCMYIN